MACRPVFVAIVKSSMVKVVSVEFSWYPGYSINQKQKSIQDLHEKARNRGIANILEVSSKSEVPLGVALSAFNLKSKALISGREFSVESAFQGSKVFENGGPYSDLIFGDSRAAKKDPRLKMSGHLIGFNFMGIEFPLKPFSLFYDWLYINTLLKNTQLIEGLRGYEAFTDIEFNPNKSINCQAFALALFMVLDKSNCLGSDKITLERFKEITRRIYMCSTGHINVQARITVDA